MNVSELDTTCTIEAIVKIIGRAQRMKTGTDCAMREVAGVLKSRYPSCFIALQTDGASGFTAGHGIGQVILDKLSNRLDQFFEIMEGKSSVLEHRGNAPLVSQFNTVYGTKFFESLAVAIVTCADSGNRIGMVGLLSRELEGFSLDDVRFLISVSELIALLLANRSLIHSSRCCEESIEIAKNEWEQTVDALPQLVFLLDANGKITRANRVVEDWNLSQVKRVGGRDCHAVLHPHCIEEDCELRLRLKTELAYLSMHRHAQWEYFDKPLSREIRVSLRYLATEDQLNSYRIESCAALVLTDITLERRARDLLRSNNSDLQQKLWETAALLRKINGELEQQIAEHVKDKAALKESESRYACLVDTTLTGIYILKDQVLVFCNRRFAEILGCSIEQLYGVRLTDLVRFSSDSSSQAQGADPLEEMSGATVVKVLHPDGRTIWLNQSTAKVVHKGQSAILGNVVDITELVVTQDRLEASKAELEALSIKFIDVQEQERKRVANDLHDGIGQTLSGIKMAVENVVREMERGRGTTTEKLRDLLVKVQMGIDEVRRISMNLRPATLDQLGIVATISWFCRECAAELPHMEIQKEVDVIEEHIGEEIKATIFRILQEAFNNIAKHSQAKSATVRLYLKNKLLRLSIEDDGKGMAMNNGVTPVYSLGLISMRERAECTGGTLSIFSQIGKGTKVEVTWPANTE
ncbi:PAS domain S-box protein [Sedimenticola selenatireducens]|uniref:PAS domain-containing sensor histidine kinase n=1 Tax=Sedimenticola selenatireducens TaxID=191960 RepID=UPI002AABCDE3|nr:PAS domain S-box protein [Sedimenticola selenatireducens]